MPQLLISPVQVFNDQWEIRRKVHSAHLFIRLCLHVALQSGAYLDPSLKYPQESVQASLRADCFKEIFKIRCSGLWLRLLRLPNSNI